MTIQLLQTKGKVRKSGGRCQAKRCREGTNCVHSFYDPSFEQCFSAFLVLRTHMAQFIVTNED